MIRAVIVFVLACAAVWMPWEGSAQAQANLGVDYAKLIILLNDLAAERDDFTFTLC